jgi:hypothetical protein
MSLGAISPESHEVLARGAGAIGARSNSAIKQVASARLSRVVLGDRNQNGAKSGEGGQTHIARLRYCLPGVMRISLRHLLNREPRVAHLYTQAVLTAREGRRQTCVAVGHWHDRGGRCEGERGRNHNLGVHWRDWECGLAEVQQALLLSDLRCVSVRVEAAALVGQFPVGIATQDASLRAKFAGSSAHLSTFFTEIAEDVRRILASIGCRTLCDVGGHTGKDLDLARLLYVLAVVADNSFAIAERSRVSKRYTANNNYRSIGCRAAMSDFRRTQSISHSQGVRGRRWAHSWSTE